MSEKLTINDHVFETISPQNYYKLSDYILGMRGWLKDYIFFYWFWFISFSDSTLLFLFVIVYDLLIFGECKASWKLEFYLDFLCYWFFLLYLEKI